MISVFLPDEAELHLEPMTRDYIFFWPLVDHLPGCVPVRSFIRFGTTWPISE